MSRRSAVLVVLFAVLTSSFVSAAAASAHPSRAPRYNPVIFVHGGAGSGAQFESQKMRFTSNGYPRRYIYVLEYDTATPITENLGEVHAALDALIERVKAETGKARVDVVGHSRGTTVMHWYLSSPARAANVGHYVNVDGRTAATPPGGVETLAIWAGRGDPGRAIGGARNVTIPNQTHVEVATSRESFREMFKFFTGRRPATVDIVPERRRVRIAGRAVLFPSNVGVSGATLEVWRVRSSSGRRIGRRPDFELSVGADGGWGPVWLRPGRHYEFALLRPGSTRTHHFFYEPFVRSDDLVRLLTSEPGEGLDLLVEKSDRHSSLVITRNKELWGDQGAESDVLTVNGTNLLNAATAPITKRLIGLFAFDVGSDGVSNVDAPLPALAALPFVSGVDHFIPAQPDGRGTVSVSLRSRGSGPTRTINFPNRPSTQATNSIQLHDFERVCRRCARHWWPWR